MIVSGETVDHRIATIYYETLVDFFEARPTCYDYFENFIVAHEIAHQFGLTDETDTNGLMDGNSWGADIDNNCHAQFKPLLTPDNLHSIRGIDFPSE